MNITLTSSTTSCVRKPFFLSLYQKQSYDVCMYLLSGQGQVAELVSKCVMGVQWGLKWQPGWFVLLLVAIVTNFSRPLPRLFLNNFCIFAISSAHTSNELNPCRKCSRTDPASYANCNSDVFKICFGKLAKPCLLHPVTISRKPTRPWTQLYRFLKEHDSIISLIIAREAYRTIPGLVVNCVQDLIDSKVKRDTFFPSAIIPTEGHPQSPYLARHGAIILK